MGPTRGPGPSTGVSPRALAERWGHTDPDLIRSLAEDEQRAVKPDAGDGRLRTSSAGSNGSTGRVATYPSRAAARRSLFVYIEVFYNRQCLHSTLGYRSPVQFEERFA